MQRIQIEVATANIDFNTVHSSLQAVAGMAHVVREDGLESSVYQLSYDDNNIWVDFPDEVDPKAVEAATTSAKVAAWTTVATVLANVGQADSARAEIVSGNLQAAGVTQEDLPAKYQDLLARAKAGIPWFEGFAGGKDPTDAELAAALTKFQALPQATKDRALFNCLRTLAAIMRYNTGDL